MKHIYILTLLSFLSVEFLSAQCVENSHSPFRSQGWKSCQESLSVIPERGERHWIMYDLGMGYKILDLQLWNHNVWGETGLGVKTLFIDYSMDMNSWSTAGPFDIERASGSWKYIAPEAIELIDMEARYLLITVIDTWDDNVDCAGFGELKMNVEKIVAADDLSEDLISEIHPNPASEWIHFEIEDYESILQMDLINAVGQHVSNLNVPSRAEISVPVSNLESGVYYISIKTTAGQASKSFIKM